MTTRLGFMIHELNVSEKDTELQTAQNKARMSHVKSQHVSREFSYVDSLHALLLKLVLTLRFFESWPTSRGLGPV